MKRQTTGTLIAAAALGVAGCGGHARHAARAPQPKLPHALAQQLARESDVVAASLDAGDACGALTAARALQQHTIDAINRHQIPSALQEPLGNAVADLATGIHCVPTPPHDQGKHNGEQKHRKHREAGD